MSKQLVLTHKRKDARILSPLRKFFVAYGHVHVPNLPEYESLYDLCNRLRMTRSQLSRAITKELDSMGFLWDMHLSNELRWHYHFAELRNFYLQYGHTRVQAKSGEHRKLGVWVQRQRKDESILSLQKRRLLKDVGFQWSSDIQRRKEQDWKEMFNRLKVFFKKHGHSNVSDGYKLDEKLGRWVSTVRSREKHLETWKKKLLKTVKFRFRDDIKKDKERNRLLLFRKLERFYNQFGHVNVPETFKDSKLAISVAYLRQHPERIKPYEKKQLKAWGFLLSEDIRVRWEQLWLKSFRKLQKFKAKHGHCRVSSSYIDQPLARWVASQRIDKKHGKLPIHRQQQLRSIGFSFYEDIAALQEKKWISMYNKLLRFKKDKATTAVPESHHDTKLVYWVQHQRQAKRTMIRTRKRLLDEIGFIWRLK